MDLLKELKSMPMTLDLLQVSCTVMVKSLSLHLDEFKMLSK